MPYNPKSLLNLRPPYSAPDNPGGTVNLTCKIRPDQAEALARVAAERGISRGVLLREILDRWLATGP